MNFTISQPTWLPTGFTLDHVTVKNVGNISSTQLVYTNSTGTHLAVNQHPQPYKDVFSGGSETSVTVDGHNASYVSISQVSSVSWNCSDFHYAVTGSLDKQTLLKIANSTACAS